MKKVGIVINNNGAASLFNPTFGCGDKETIDFSEACRNPDAAMSIIWHEDATKESLQAAIDHLTAKLEDLLDDRPTRGDG